MAVASIATYFSFNGSEVSADQYTAKIRALESDMSRFQAEANRLNAESASLANTLAQITNERNALQAQVDLSQAKHDQLVRDIAETEKKIEENRSALGLVIVDLYADDDISPVEMLASSKNIGDYLNKQEYRNSVKDDLNSVIKKVRDLKAELDAQKVAVTKVLNEQKVARDGLVAKEAEQSSILAKTQNDEAEYRNLIKGREAEIAETRAVQAAMAARVNASGSGSQIVNAGSLGAYPWNASNCPMLGMLSTGGANGVGGDRVGSPYYGCRQCASYAAWKIAKETGVYYWNWGNGKDFYHNAVGAGYRDLGRSPQPGSIAVMTAGQYGHVAWVEEVSADGSRVRVSQYNYNYGAGWGMYSDMWLGTSVFDKYVKIK